jgi:hypothetical protein
VTVRAPTLLPLFAALVLALGAGCARSAPTPTGPVVTVALTALDGGAIELGRYRDRVVVLHLFTTWSLAAQQDLDQLAEVHEALGDRVTVIGVGIDPDGRRVVAPWRAATGVPYLVALGSADLVAGGTALGRIAQVPTTIILAPGGRVAHRIERVLAPGELRKLISPWLADSGTAAVRRVAGR